MSVCMCVHIYICIHIYGSSLDFYNMFFVCQFSLFAVDDVCSSRLRSSIYIYLYTWAYIHMQYCFEDISTS